MNAGTRVGSVRPYDRADADAWDAFVARTVNGTFLHSRRFLDYHGDRFVDRSLCFFDPEGRWCGALAAALDTTDSSTVVSHPGATYGGLVHLRRATAGLVAAMIAAARSHYADDGLSRLRYNSVPVALHSLPCELDVHALWADGARLVRRDVWSVADVAHNRVDGERHRLARRAAAGYRLDVDASPAGYAQFHAMLSARLIERHRAVPTHTVGQMLDLQRRFPEHIALWLARGIDGDCHAGCWIFDFGHTWHLQYAGTTAEGRRTSAQDALLEHVLATARARGTLRFSFGSSSESEGRKLNEGLHFYKAAFGAGTQLHDHYELDLR